jgi:hypothetical protein
MIEVTLKRPDKVAAGTVHTGSRNHVPNHKRDADRGVPVYQGTTNGRVSVVGYLEESQQQLWEVLLKWRWWILAIFSRVKRSYNNVYQY